jgi:RHS repeat-associated protein
VGRLSAIGGVDSTGQFAYRIPIEVAPGRMAPDLALVYSSGGGSGISGVGWSLTGGSQITRCGKIPAAGGVRARPTYEFTNPNHGGPFGGLFDDGYCLDGQRLYLVSGTMDDDSAVFRTEVDTYARITVHGGPGEFGGPVAWSVEYKNGLVAYYQYSQVNGEAPVTTWPLQQIVDRSHNAQYWAGATGTGYVSSDSAQENHAGLSFPGTIAYNQCGAIKTAVNQAPRDPFDCPYTSPDGNLERQVVFTYEDRPSAADTITHYVAGDAHTISKRLKTITSQVNAPGGWKTYREYRLTYATSDYTGRSLLTDVTEYDGSAASSAHTQTMHFSYPTTETIPRYKITSQSRGGFTYTSKLNGTDNAMEIAVADVSGDGNGDILLREWATAAGGTPPSGADTSYTDELLLGDGNGYVKSPVAVSWPSAAERQVAPAELPCLSGHWGMALPVDLKGNGQTYAVMECGKSYTIPGSPSTTAVGYYYAVLGWDPATGTLKEQTSLTDIDGKRLPNWPVDPGIAWPANGILQFADVDGDGLPDLLGAPTGGTTIPPNATWQYRKASFTGPGAGQGLTYAAETSAGVPLLGAPDPGSPTVGQGCTICAKRLDTTVRVLDEDGDGHVELMQADYEDKQRSFTLAPSGSALYGYRDNQQNVATHSTSTLPNWGTPSFDGFAVWNVGQWYYIDVNGDGLKDALFRTESLTGGAPTWSLRINTGEGYLPASTDLGPGTATLVALSTDLGFADSGAVVKGRDNGLRIADMNGDGREDLVLLDPPGAASVSFTVTPNIATRWKSQTVGPVVLFANNTGFDAPVSLPAPTGSRVRLREATSYLGATRFPLSAVSDIDGDGVAEVVELMGDTSALTRTLMTTSLSNRNVDRISTVSVLNGSAAHQTHQIGYDGLSAGSALRKTTYTDDTHIPLARNYPQAQLATGIVVRTLVNSAGPRSISQEYHYRGALTDVTGRGFLGFGELSSTDKITGITTTSTFDTTPRFDPAFPSYHYYPLLGQPTDTTTSAPATGAGHHSQLVDATGSVPQPYGGFSADFAGNPLRMTALRTGVHADSGGTPPSITTSTTYDSFGNPSPVTTTFADTTHGRTYTSTVTNQFTNDTTKWLIGMKTRSVEDLSVDSGALPSPATNGDANGFSRTAHVELSYTPDLNTGLLLGMSRVIGNGVGRLAGTSAVSKWDVQRDAAGQVKTVTRSLPQQGATTCVSSSTCGAGRQCVSGKCYLARTTSFTYDATGTVVESVTDPLGHTEWALHDPLLFLPYVVSDANGVETKIYRDTFGRVVQVTRDTGESFTRSYTASSSSSSIRTDWSDGAANVVYNDASGRPYLQAWKTFESMAAVEKTTFNVLGMPTKVVYGSDGTTAFESAVVSSLTAATLLNANPIQRYAATYDALGRAVSITDGTNDTRTISYVSPLGTTTVTDLGTNGQNLTHTTQSDILGRTLQVSETFQSGTTKTTKYYYGPFGSLQQISAPNGFSDRFYVDEIGRPVEWSTVNTASSSSAPQIARRKVTFDGFDEESTVETNGLAASFTRDALGRPLTRTTAAGTSPSGIAIAAETQTFAWDPAQGIGQLGSATTSTDTNSHSVVMSYDKGRWSQRTESLNGGAPLSFSRTFDTTGHLSDLLYPEYNSSERTHTMAAGERLRHVYQNGLLKSIGALNPSQAGAFETIYAVNHRHPYGMVTEAVYGVGINHVALTRTASWTYNPNTLRMITQSATGTSGDLINQTFGYNNNGTLSSRTASGYSETFDYEGTAEILRTYHRTGPGSSVVDATYQVDNQGLIKISGSAANATDWPGTESYTFLSTPYQIDKQSVTPPGGSVVTKTFSYDDYGRVKAAGTKTYSWNSFSQPKQVQDGTTVRSFGYDAFGQRVLKTQDATNRVRYVTKAFEQRDLPAYGKAESLFRIFGETGLLFEIAHPWNTSERRIRPYFTDQQGSPEYIVNTSNVSFQRGFFPYGKRMGPPPSFTFSDIGYTGHIQDDDLDLINMRGRMFDVSSHRFLTRDLIADQPFKAYGTNPYAYVGNNPTNLFDPSGFQGMASQRVGNSQADLPPPCNSADCNEVDYSNEEDPTRFYQDAAYSKQWGADGSEMKDPVGPESLNVATDPGNISSISSTGPVGGGDLSWIFAKPNAVTRFRAQLAGLSWQLQDMKGISFNNQTGVVRPRASLVGALGSEAAGVLRSLLAPLDPTAPPDERVIGFGQAASIAVAPLAAEAAGGVDAAGGVEAVAGAGAAERAMAYPPNNGFLGGTSARVLQKGEVIDRVGGHAASRFFSPVGTPAAARALPPGTSGPLRTFEVMKPFSVEAGTVAPWYGQEGLGTQFRSGMPLGELLDQGFLVEKP